MKLLRNFLAGFIAFFLVPLLLGFLFINNVSRVLLNETQFLGTLKENKTYETIASKILPEVVINLVSGDTNREGLPKEVVTQVVSTIDKDKLATDLENVFSEVYRYTVGTKAELSAQIDISPYTSSLQTQLTPVFANYLQNLPECTAEQQVLQEEGDGVSQCRPTDKTTEELLKESEVESMVSDLSLNAPKALIITKNKITTDPPITIGSGETITTPQEQNQNFDLENIRNLTLAANSSSTYILGAIVLLLILLVVSQIPSFTASFRWLAWVFVSAAAVPLIISSLFLFFVKPSTFENNLSSVIDSQGRSYEGDAIALITENISDLGNKIFQGIQLQSLVLVIIAAGLFILAVVLEHRKKSVSSEISKMEEKAGIKVS